MMDTSLPKAAWIDHEVSMLEDAWQRFHGRECARHYEDWLAAGAFSRDLWGKAGEMGPPGAAVTGEYGGSFADDAVIANQGKLTGTDGRGGGLHNADDFGSDGMVLKMLEPDVEDSIGAVIDKCALH